MMNEELMVHEVDEEGVYAEKASNCAKVGTANGVLMQMPHMDETIQHRTH